MYFKYIYTYVHNVYLNHFFVRPFLVVYVNSSIDR